MLERFFKRLVGQGKSLPEPHAPRHNLSGNVPESEVGAHDLDGSEPVPSEPRPQVLVAASRLVDLAGAEITCLELASVLQQRFDVTIVANEVGNPWFSQLPPGVRAVRPEQIVGNRYHIAWVHHFPMAYRLFATNLISAEFAMFSSLSYFEPIESPPVTSIKFSVYSVNSIESLAKFRVLYPELADSVIVIPNGCPDDFLSSFEPRLNDVPLRSIAVISNHPPREVIGASRELGRKGIRVDHIGIGGIVERVTPAVLRRYDAVITIGKTVQYCLGSGIPVFCYDRFGGPGWITPSNIDQAVSTNFSGRESRADATEGELVAEVLGGYRDTHLAREPLRRYVETRLSTSTLVNGAIEKIVLRPFRNDLNRADAESVLRVAELYELQRSVIGSLQERQ